MNGIGALLGILTILGAGFGLSSFFFKPGSFVPAAELFGFSWLLGCLAVSLLLFAGGAFLAGGWLHVCTAAVSIGLALRGADALRRGRFTAGGVRPRGIREWLLLAMLAAEAAWICRACFATVLDWDGLLIWEMKARIAFLHGGALPHAYLIDQNRDWAHPDYPLGLPFAELWIYLWIGDADQFWVKAIFALFYPVAMGLLYSGAVALGGSRVLGMLAAGALFCIPAVVIGTGSLPSGYADFPLGVFYLGAVVCLLRAGRTGWKGDFMLAALMIGALPWIKREGTILAACLVGIAVLWMGRREWKRIWILAVPGLVIAAGWRLFLIVNHVPARPDHERLSAAALVRNAGRIPGIARRLELEAVDWRHWSLLWPGAICAAALLLIRPGKQRGNGLMAGFAAAAPLCIYAATYIFSNWPSWEMHMDISFPRLVLQIAPVALLMIAGACAHTTRSLSEEANETECGNGAE